MTERVCAWCGASLEGRTVRAKYCGANCKQNYFRGHWDADKRSAALQYNKEYYRKNAERLKSEQREWNAKNQDHRRLMDAEYYSRNRRARMEYQRQYSFAMKTETPERYREYLTSQAERSRRRAAERALAILILDQPPET